MTGNHIVSIGKTSCTTTLGSQLVNDCRFVDRDMLMQYFWGLGVGHQYSHGKTHLHNLEHGPEEVAGDNSGHGDLDDDGQSISGGSRSCSDEAEESEFHDDLEDSE